MNGYLVDTCIISELAKRAPAPEVIRWFESTSENLFLSAVTVEEFLTGLRFLGSDKKLSFFYAMMREEYEVLPVTFQVAERSSNLRHGARVQGTPMDIADALIAATALEEKLILVTRNVKDFAKSGVSVLNPFDLTLDQNQPPR